MHLPRDIAELFDKGRAEAEAVPPPAKFLDGVVKVDPMRAKALGFVGKGCYLPNGVNGATCLTKAEAVVNTAADFPMFSLCEIAPDAAKGGESAGVAFAQLFTRSAASVGQTKGALIAAVDVDPAELPPGSGVAFFRGFSQIRQAGFLVGGYLGALLDNEVLAAGFIDVPMLPGAASWADGATAKRAAILQQVSQVNIDGADYDVDLVPDVTKAGLWTLHGTWPAPITKPVTPEEDDVKPFIVKHPTIHAENVCVWGPRAFIVPDYQSQKWLEEQGAVLGAGVTKAPVAAPAEPPQSLVAVLLGC